MKTSTVIVMLLLSLLFACLVQPVLSQGSQSEFSLTSSPNTDVVQHITKDVNLRCQNSGKASSQFKEIVRINIEKKTTGGSWEIVAGISYPSQIVTVEDLNISANGNVEKEINGSYLEVIWAVALNKTAGVYTCHVIGMNNNLDVISEKTSETEIKEAPMTLHLLLQLFLEERKNTNRAVKSLRNDIMQPADKDEKVDELIEDILNISNSNNKTNTIVDELIKKMDIMQDELETLSQEKQQTDNTLENLKEELDELSSKMNSINGSGYTVLPKWPQGSYSLLETDTGCPVAIEFISQEDETFKMRAESSDSASHGTTMSSNIHLSKPILDRVGSSNMLYFRFCHAFVSLRTHLWPRGSYCIQKKSSRVCPTGMERGALLLDEEDDGNPGQFFGISTRVGLFFCCMASGSPSNPIQLPTHSPFYLYRRGGQCQNVTGMSVIEEFIKIDTENSRNVDKFYDTHPDGTIDNRGGSVRLQLCYYS